MADKTALPQFFEIRVNCLALAIRLLAVTLQHGFSDGGAGVDGVHVDSKGTERVRQGLRQGDRRNITGRRADRGARRASGTTAQVNNPAPTRLLHVGRSLACAAIVAKEFLFEILDDLLVTDLVHVVRDGAADASGTVGEDMNSAESVGRRLDESFDRFYVQHVHD